MGGKICGHCTNWRCDEPLHLKGHCIINRLDRFHRTMCGTCTKYQNKWEYIRPLTKEAQEAENDCSKA